MDSLAWLISTLELGSGAIAKGILSEAAKDAYRRLKESLAGRSADAASTLDALESQTSGAAPTERLEKELRRVGAAPSSEEWTDARVLLEDLSRLRTAAPNHKVGFVAVLDVAERAEVLLRRIDTAGGEVVAKGIGADARILIEDVDTGGGRSRKTKKRRAPSYPRTTPGNRAR